MNDLIRRARRACAGLTPELEWMGNVLDDPILRREVEEMVAARDWLQRGYSCDLCHGTGYCEVPVIEDPVVYHETDGKLYRPGGLNVNGVIYRGYVEVTMDELMPKAKRSICKHGKNENINLKNRKTS